MPLKYTCKINFMAPIKRKKSIKTNRKIVRDIATQVTHRDLDEYLEIMCEDPRTHYDIYNFNLMKRKKEKYPKLLLKSDVIRVSSEELRQPVPYRLEPQTIYKNSRKLC